MYGQGDTDKEADASHDQAFRGLLDRCRKRHLKLSPKKFKFKMRSLGYMGHIFSNQRLAPDAEKLMAINGMSCPTDAQGVQRLLGLVTYLAKFLPKLSTACEPLRSLTDKQLEFDWLPHHEDAFTTVKQLIKAHSPYRDELIVSNELVFRGMRIIIPTSMRREVVTRAHASHMGTEYTANTAREVMYWPGMHSELAEAVRRCSTGQEIQPAQSKEPLMTHPLINLPLQVVATDYHETAGHHYCVFFDVHSDYIDICELEDLTGQTLVNKNKQVFATHGIPVTLISDNGPICASREFSDFARSWDFLRITSSPHHSQSNGRAEAAVKTMKNVIKKVETHGRQSMNGGTQSFQEQTVHQSKD